MAGQVRVNGQVETKASRQVDDAAAIEIEAPPRFVSRGGEKLEGAFELWGTGNGERGIGLDAAGKICLDVGSSTGGFTDCLLQHGAKMVMAVDVGTNQLAYSLRSDPRVWVKENFNARYMTRDDLPETPELAVTDVSFISLRLILPPIARVLAPGGGIVSLVKPQFEAGREEVGRGGVVRSEAVRQRVVEEIREFGVGQLGLEWIGACESPIRGAAGNVEYTAYWRKPGTPS